MGEYNEREKNEFRNIFLTTGGAVFVVLLAFAIVGFIHVVFYLWGVILGC